jgi:hypothetical protein
MKGDLVPVLKKNNSCKTYNFIIKVGKCGNGLMFRFIHDIQEVMDGDKSNFSLGYDPWMIIKTEDVNDSNKLIYQLIHLGSEECYYTFASLMLLKIFIKLTRDILI